MKSRFWMVSAVVLLAATNPVLAQSAVTPSIKHRAVEYCTYYTGVHNGAFTYGGKSDWPIDWQISQLNIDFTDTIDYIDRCNESGYPIFKNKGVASSSNDIKHADEDKIPQTPTDKITFISIFSLTALLFTLTFYLMFSKMRVNMPGLRALDDDELKSIRSIYSGFEIAHDEFKIYGDNLRARVNSSGDVIPIDIIIKNKPFPYWSFDERSGEFYKSYRPKHGMNFVNAVPFSKRSVDYAMGKVGSNSLKDKFYALAGFLIFLFANGSLIQTAWKDPASATRGTGLPMILGITAFFAILGGASLALMVARSNSTWGKIKFVGPEPLSFKVEDFGPNAGPMPDTGEAVPLDEYTPNA